MENTPDHLTEFSLIYDFPTPKSIAICHIKLTTPRGPIGEWYLPASLNVFAHSPKPRHPHWLTSELCYGRALMAEHQVVHRFLSHDNYLCDFVSHTVKLIGRRLDSCLPYDGI
jgi:hypothetical protein